MAVEVALVVGAGDVIGSAIMRKFADQGFTVCGARRNAEKLQGLVDDLADNYVMLHQQPRNAWTFELDLRPWTENW